MSAKCITTGAHDSFRTGRPELTNNMPGPIPLPPDVTIKLVALGWKHGHIVTNDNQLYSWGIGKSYRLGTGEKSDSELPVRVNLIPKDFDFRMLAAGDAFTAAISTDGKMLVWGSKYAHVPTLVKLPSGASYLACGHSSVVCALSNGSVQVLNNKASSKNIEIPKEPIIMTAAGNNHFLALTTAGSVYSWGMAEASGHSVEKQIPTKLDITIESRISAIFAYQDNSWFVDKQNNVYRCGKNEEGCLGNGGVDAIKTPTKLDFDFGFNNRITQIACGDNFTIILTDTGKAYAAGSCKECRTAIDPTNYPESKRFNQCTYGIEPGITQIACGCYSAAFVIDGGYPPAVQYQFNSFREYPVQSLPSSYLTEEGENVTADPYSTDLELVGLKAEDIIQFEDGVRAKVVGATEDGRIVAVTEQISIRCYPTLNYEAVLFRIELLERRGHKINSFPFMNKNMIQLDISDNELLKFRGMKCNDKLSDGAIIIGARGPHLYAYTTDSLLKEILPKFASVVSREKKCIETIDFVDGTSKVVETNEADNSLRLDYQHGAGIFLGRVHKLYCYRFAADFGLARLLERNCDFARDKGRTIKSFTIYMKPVTLSISPCCNLYPLDFVLTNMGYGCLAGFDENKPAVWLENNRGNLGSVMVFDNPTDVVAKARLFAPLSIDGMSASSYDFDKFHFLPGDEIELNDVIYLICGTKEGKLFAAVPIDDEGNYDHSHVVEIDWEKARLIKRHLYAGTSIVIDGIEVGCCSQIAKSAKLVRCGKKIGDYQVMGLFDHSRLLLRKGNETVITSFTLPKG